MKLAPAVVAVGLVAAVLSQLKQFLPKMQQANVELQQKLQVWIQGMPPPATAVAALVAAHLARNCFTLSSTYVNQLEAVGPPAEQTRS
jgi:hypothetical protein